MLLLALTALLLSSAPPDPVAEKDEPLRLRTNVSFGLGFAHGIVGVQYGLNYGIIGAFGSLSVFSPLMRRGQAEQTSSGFGGGVRLFIRWREPRLLVQAAALHEVPHPSPMQRYGASIGPRTSVSLTASVRFALNPVTYFDLGCGVGAYRSNEQQHDVNTGRLSWQRREGLASDLNLALGFEF